MIFGALDGIGWLLDLETTLMASYAWATPERVRKLPLRRAWAYYAAARLREASALGVCWRIRGTGYIGQERDKILNDPKTKIWLAAEQ